MTEHTVFRSQSLKLGELSIVRAATASTAWNVSSEYHQEKPIPLVKGNGEGLPGKNCADGNFDDSGWIKRMLFRSLAIWLKYGGIWCTSLHWFAWSIGHSVHSPYWVLVSSKRSSATVGLVSPPQRPAVGGNETGYATEPDNVSQNAYVIESLDTNKQPSQTCGRRRIQVLSA